MATKKRKKRELRPGQTKVVNAGGKRMRVKKLKSGKVRFVGKASETTKKGTKKKRHRAR